MICGILKVVNSTVQESHLNTLLVYKAEGIDNSQVHAKCITLSIVHTECLLASEHTQSAVSRGTTPFLTAHNI